ncbi:hypothetical protein, partial [Actinomyces ruminis]|uniref:hypothetical protein n=1 Tax=Actinomyces ruminis TaxID=1937003 RepID=UPI001C5592A4
PDPNTTTWYTTDTNGAHHITLKTNQQTIDFNGWIGAGAGGSEDVANTLTDVKLRQGTRTRSSADGFREYYGGDDW